MTLKTKKLFLPLALAIFSIGLLTGFQSGHALGATQPQQPTVCKIRGTVASLQRVSTAEAPSTLAEQETHISVNIQERSARYKKIDASNDPCARLADKEFRTYKLCSPTRVRKGDIINGTEGVETGPSAPVGCLFDLVVLSKQ